MSEIFDIYNIIFLVLAVVIFFRLRSVLGKRSGNERPPFDPYSSSSKPDARDNGDLAAAGDNVIKMPGQLSDDDRHGQSPEDMADARLAKIAPNGSALNEALKQIVSADRSFEPAEFLQGASAAYEMIVSAFAAGDRKTLQSLLSKEVNDGFAEAISEREARNETVESTFIGLDKVEIVEAALKNTTAQITVRFHSQLISATKDADGRIIDGDPNRISDVTDIWTFARDTSSRDPNWKLVATESVE